MGKQACILCFILSVFLTDAKENCRHIRVVKRGDKRFCKGKTVLNANLM